MLIFEYVKGVMAALLQRPTERRLLIKARGDHMAKVAEVSMTITAGSGYGSMFMKKNIRF